MRYESFSLTLEYNLEYTADVGFYHYPADPLQDQHTMGNIQSNETAFEEIKESIRADEKGRVTLGRDYSGKNFSVWKSADGNILLTPVAVVPERDIWLYKNPRALALFHQGLAGAAAGQVTPGEDFSQYADDDIGDE